MKYLMFFFLLCFQNIALAGSTFKCETSEGTIYQATPCPKNAKVTEFKKTSKDAPKTLCDSAAKAAESIMQARQNGADMSQMSNNILSIDTIPEVKDLATAMINSAYETPRFSSAEYQQRAIRDFKNETYLSCVKAGLNKLK